MESRLTPGSSGNIIAKLTHVVAGDKVVLACELLRTFTCILVLRCDARAFRLGRIIYQCEVATISFNNLDRPRLIT